MAEINKTYELVVREFTEIKTKDLQRRAPSVDRNSAEEPALPAPFTSLRAEISGGSFF
ncbi:MAG: hypothetical protein LBD99_05810 [Candidatus Margulisbacteria bacterium]|jgi:hypothetical protein|nr:hypothetical protein [Candidatus Margulisiibacteriota bacterium]